MREISFSNILTKIYGLIIKRLDQAVPPGLSQMLIGRVRRPFGLIWIQPAINMIWHFCQKRQLMTEAGLRKSFSGAWIRWTALSRLSINVRAFLYPSRWSHS